MPTRPGNRRKRQAASPAPSSIQNSVDKASLPTPIPTVHRRRIAESQNQANTSNKRKRARISNDEDFTVDIEEEIETDLNPEEPTNTQTDVTPTISNYRKLGMEWGIARAEQYLADLKLPKNNRPSSNGLFEAQGLQSAYETDKTMLCIVLKVSRRVLDEALLEGPLACKPNMYTNYQTYSNVATKTAMPPKGVSLGFQERNRLVGSTWSTYVDEEQAVFKPQYFERLCVATSEAYALTTTPLGISASVAVQHNTPPPVSNPSPSKKSKLMSQSLNAWSTYRKSHATSTREDFGGTLEISRVVRQLNILKNHFNLNFHLLMACWNPATTTARALFQVEHTSCNRWARQQEKQHLLEKFTFESTRAPQHLRTQRPDSKPQTDSAARQAEKRSELAKALNGLIVPYLCGGYQGKGDAHPKCPNLREAFATKTFRGDVALSFNRTLNSQVTDLMISKGPGCLTNDEVEAWFNDIQSKRYTVIIDETNTKKKTNEKKRKRKNRHTLTAEEAALDDNPIPDLDCKSNSSQGNSSLESVQILEQLTGFEHHPSNN
ncbi:uncharacterized protein MELLADRAFT_88567 [Melampsora larici-populina 98AG31]|uniref:Uncharacterized protein n=1 Tax=Melampsora larici-populina (strain 98AG31 / pathotype 3-4-7) TaxID=747676 RepID=F4RS77_MELLP|nr:uncharacterized protein MELLADRAFT_88567 [Melampsora larici-populina 98AG31]EGG04808.1 hypothetical protein MELLADRAFT_88567 [Melampsora larici-populina 98AG31]